MGRGECKKRTKVIQDVNVFALMKNLNPVGFYVSLEAASSLRRFNRCDCCWSPGHWRTCWSSRGLRWARWKTPLQPAPPAKDGPMAFQPGWCVAGVVSASTHARTRAHTKAERVCTFCKSTIPLIFIVRIETRLWIWKTTTDFFPSMSWKFLAELKIIVIK